jgi:hypothetical protein
MRWGQVAGAVPTRCDPSSAQRFSFFHARAAILDFHNTRADLRNGGDLAARATTVGPSRVRNEPATAIAPAPRAHDEAQRTTRMPGSGSAGSPTCRVPRSRRLTIGYRRRLTSLESATRRRQLPARDVHRAPPRLMRTRARAQSRFSVVSDQGVSAVLAEHSGPAQRPARLPPRAAPVGRAAWRVHPVDSKRSPTRCAGGG